MLRSTLLAFSFACGVSGACASTASLPRAGFLGVQAAGVTDEVRSRLGLSENNGALVAKVVAGGSAEALGLRPDDVIVAVDGRAIADPGELIARIAPHRAGDRVSIRWIRDGKVQSSE